MDDLRAAPRTLDRQRQRTRDPEHDHMSAGAGLRADALYKAYGQKPVVRGIEFHVQPGEVVGLLGPNGAGKTTSFHIIVGLIRPDKGRILLGDVDISREPMYQRARLGIGYLAQEPSIFRRL